MISRAHWSSVLHEPRRLLHLSSEEDSGGIANLGLIRYKELL